MALPTRISTPNRADVLRDRVQGLARELGPGAKFPKVVDLCRDWQVSPTTLTRVMSGLEEEGWLRRQHAVGIFVAEDVPMSHLLSSVAIICRPSFFQSAGHSPFWGSLLRSSQQSAARHGVSCDLYFSRDLDETAEKPLPEALSLAFENRKIGAVIGIGLDDGSAAWLMERGVPVVNVFGKGHVIVGFDTASATEISVAGLLERGCQHIALCVDLPPNTSTFHKKFTMQEWQILFRESLRRRNFAGKTQVLIGEHERFPLSVDQGFAAAQRLFSGPRSSWPDGLMSVNDMFTHGMLGALRKLGVQVGRDVQIATHANANSPILHGESEPIRVEYDPDEIVRVVWHELETLLLTRDWPTDKHHNIAPHRA